MDLKYKIQLKLVAQSAKQLLQNLQNYCCRICSATGKLNEHCDLCWEFSKMLNVMAVNIFRFTVLFFSQKKNFDTVILSSFVYLCNFSSSIMSHSSNTQRPLTTIRKVKAVPPPTSNHSFPMTARFQARPGRRGLHSLLEPNVALDQWNKGWVVFA
jgi:hypothetical protein